MCVREDPLNRISTCMSVDGEMVTEREGEGLIANE